jgi:hypothetical protein
VSLAASSVVLCACLVYLSNRGSSWLIAAIAVVFALCAVSSAIKLCSSQTQLLVDESGIWNATWGVGTVYWTQVKQVYVRSEGKCDFICFYLREPDEVLRRLTMMHGKAFEVMRASGFGDLFLEAASLGTDAQAIVEYASKKIAERGEK